MLAPLNTSTSFPLRNALLISLSACLALILLAYLTYQARFLILGPQITLVENETSPTSAQTVVLEGAAENITHMTLNGRPIFTDQEGAFRETLVLSEGYNLITIVAKDRYGRERSVTHEYVHTDSDASSPTSVTLSDEITTAAN